jgi:cell wall-associated NlpC family hydrolase
VKTERSNGHAGIVALVLSAAMGAGCATGVVETREPDGEAPPYKTLAVQSTALNPRNGGQLVGPDALRPGDILLSADAGVTSAGIRLMTFSPVSHAALYVGDDFVAEAVGSGVRTRSIAAVLQEEAVVVAFRDPRVTDDTGGAIAAYALRQVGQRYDHLGVVLQVPFTIERRACELPFAPNLVRDFCIRGIATIQLGAFSNDQFFCSQFVLEAYRQAGLPLTDAAPRWLSPRDILHMREGDVPSVKVRQTLVYVGHLKYALPAAAPERDRAVQ